MQPANAYHVLKRGPPTGSPEGGTKVDDRSLEDDRTLDDDEKVFRCRICKRQIAREADVFSMTDEGPVGAYVNPHGYLHETVTVRSAEGVTLVGPTCAEHSWFAGYAWTSALCAGCQAHIGWLFEAVEGARPTVFWGLRRASLTGA